MARPAVSFLLPVRDGAATLPAALASLRAQTWPDWEAVLVDDGSTDGTRALLEAAARADARFRVLASPAARGTAAAGGGLVAALGAGLAAARADLVARMDADDVCAPGRLAAQVAWLAAHPGTGLVGGRVAFGGDPATAPGMARYVEWGNGLLTAAAIRRRRFIESPLVHPSVMFRRSVAEAHGAWRDGPFPEDYELWLRWLDAGVVMEKVPEVVLTWHDPPGRLTRRDPRYAPAAFFALKARHLALHLRRHPPGRPVWLWGAGRVTRRRFDALAAEGVSIAGYIDIDPRKTGRPVAGRPVVGPRDLPPPSAAFVLAGVTNPGARDLIAGRLGAAGYREEEDYLHVA